MHNDWECFGLLKPLVSVVVKVSTKLPMPYTHQGTVEAYNVQRFHITINE